MRRQVPHSISLHWRYLHQDLELSLNDIIALPRYANRFSRATVARHMNRPIDEEVFDRRRNNRGRPRAFSHRDERRILRAAEQLRKAHGHFTIKRVKTAAGVENVCDETVRRVFRKAGLRYTHSRKKGVLKRHDLRKRLQFARDMKSMGTDGQKQLWQNDIAFYLDGVGFAHKYNPFDQAKAPRSMAWRRPHDGLDFQRTARGSHEGTGGRVAHFICAISYQDGMILAEQYDGRMNGRKFAQFVIRTFNELFSNSSNPDGKLFLQDGDPSQNSKLAREAFRAVGATVFPIPPRSPDCNPIENTFHSVKEILREDALTQRITHENFEQFSIRCQQALLTFPTDIIRRTIDSMPKRMDDIIRRRGQRTKY